tara:strand:- start:248 stop:961 length:714 start_codon:yes stop_codon:yes gene_type:complete
MLNNKSDFILDYNEKKDKNLKRNEIDWSQSRIIFISQSFNSYQKNSVNFKDVPFELWEIRKFSDKMISLNQHQSNSKESIQKIEGKEHSVVKDVSKEVKVFTEEDVLSSSSDSVKSIWRNIVEKISESGFDDTRLQYKKHYCRFSRNNNDVIGYFNFQKNRIKGEIIVGTIYEDGHTSKVYCDINDYKNKLELKERFWKDSKTKHVEYQFIIDDHKEIDYLIILFKQKYDSLINLSS